MGDSKRSSNRAGVVLAVLSCLAGVLSCLAAWLVVPEFREATGMRSDAAHEEIRNLREELERSRLISSESDEWSHPDAQTRTGRRVAEAPKTSRSAEYGDESSSQSPPTVPLSRTLSSPVETLERIDAASRVSYAVAAYCYSVTEAQCQAMQQTIRDQGDTVIRGGLLNQRPAWLAAQSTVLFYDMSAAADARRLAAILHGRTGIWFDVLQGSGLGVSSGQRPYSLRVHFIGN
jgi:hypothetical protein